MQKHSSHKEIITRLKRANGHLSSVIKMIEDGRPCVETAQQMQAVVKALENAKKTFIKDHIDHCITAPASDSGNDSGDVLSDLKEIIKYL